MNPLYQKRGWMVTELHEKRARLKKLIKLHENTIQAMLGNNPEIQRDLRNLLQKVEEEVKIVKKQIDNLQND